jgi:hypothetical protein
MESHGDPGFARHVCHSPPKSALPITTAVSQVAVAQHFGLQILRLADSWILPINTTHYSIELQSYLDKSAVVWSISLPFSQRFLSGSKILLRRVLLYRGLIFTISVIPSRNCKKPA